MKSKSIGSLIVLALLAPSCLGGGGGKAPPKSPVLPQWQTQQRSPTSSDLRCVIFANAAQGIVAGKDGSFFRTDDGGITWSQMEFQPENLSADIVALSAFGTTLVAAGQDTATGNGRVYEGRNSTSWVTSVAPATGAVYTDASVSDAGYGNVPGTWWALRSDGVIDYSFNGLAGSFTAIPAPWTPPPPLFAWTSANGIWMNYYGVGWVVGEGTGGVNSGTGRIIRTPDFGTTWIDNTITPTNTKTLRRMFVTKTTSYTARSYIVGDNATDNGMVLVSHPTTADAWDEVTQNPGGIPSLRSLSFPEFNDLGYVVGNAGTIYRLTLAGSTWTWTQQAIGLTTQDLYSVSFVNKDIGYAVGNNGVVLKTTNGSTAGTWSIISKGDATVAFNAVAFRDDGVRGIAVGDNGRIFRTLDGGVNWSSMTAGPGPNYLGASVPRTGAGTFAYVCGAGGALLQNADVWGIGVWTQVNGTTVTDTYRAVLFPQAEDKGVCVGNTNAGAAQLLQTNDGLNWSGAGTAPTFPIASYNALSSNLNGGTVYAAGGTDGLTSISQDVPGGYDVWADLAPQLGGGLTIASFASPEGVSKRAFAAAGTATYFLTTGMTPTWTVSTTMPWGGAVPTSLAFQSEASGVVVTNAGGIYTTIDGAATWQTSYPHTKDTPRAVWMSPTVAGLGYVVCNNGTILKTITGGKPSP